MSSDSSIVLPLPEGSTYVGIVISAVLYGVYIGTYYMSTSIILTSTQTTHSQRVFYTLYGTTLLILNTLNFLAMPQFSRMMWIVHRNDLGGPIAYESMEYFNIYNRVASASQNIAILMSDSFLIYRCYVVFGSQIRVIVLPALCVIAGFVSTMATLPLAIATNTILDNQLSTAGIALTTLINIFVTGMISFKILSMNRRVRDCIDARVRRTYISVVAILVESAAPCAILGILATIVYPMEYELLWFPGIFLVWSFVTALTPQLIILRIAKGVAWTSKTSEEISYAVDTIIFA